MPHLDGLEAGDAGADDFPATGVTRHEMRFDEAGGDLEVGAGVAVVDPDRHAAVGGAQVIVLLLNLAMVVEAAVQEDVDVVGLSILSGAHIPLVHAVQELFKKRSIAKPIFVGGIIPPDDAKLLKLSGVAAVFGPGTSTKEIVEELHRVLKAN